MRRYTDDDRGVQTLAQKLKFCVSRKGSDFEMVLPILRGWPASYLTRRAWHMQLWPVDQSGYVHLARQCCMVAHPWMMVLQINTRKVITFSKLCWKQNRKIWTKGWTRNFTGKFDGYQNGNLISPLKKNRVSEKRIRIPTTLYANEVFCTQIRGEVERWDFLIKTVTHGIVAACMKPPLCECFSHTYHRNWQERGIDACSWCAQVFQAASSSGTTATIGELGFIYRPSWTSAEIFPVGATLAFCLSYLGCWQSNANGRWQIALPFLHQKMLHVTAIVPKMLCVGSNSQVYCDKLYTIDYLQIFQAGYSLQRNKLPWYTKEAMTWSKPQLWLHFTQQDLPASLRNKRCKRLRQWFSIFHGLWPPSKDS